MTIDLTGGLDAEREYVFPERPEQAGMRDAVNMWVSDDRGEVGLPRFAVEALADRWDQHELQVNVALADGRVFRLRDAFPSLPTTGPDGRASVFGAGPLVFRCVEPFRTWTAEFDGTAIETSADALIAGDAEGPTVDLAFTVEATMAVPPWIQGTLFPEAAEMLATSIEGKLMGGPRFEQLFRATRRGAGRRRGASRSPAAGCGSAARASATSPSSGVTAGSRRCSRAVGPSATSRTRPGPTAASRTTRATCSPATVR